MALRRLCLLLAGINRAERRQEWERGKRVLVFVGGCMGDEDGVSVLVWGCLIGDQDDLSERVLRLTFAVAMTSATISTRS